jgi:hypothetical protein
MKLAGTEGATMRERSMGGVTAAIELMDEG